jgi:hypothetical protein
MKVHHKIQLLEKITLASLKIVTGILLHIKQKLRSVNC